MCSFSSRLRYNRFRADTRAIPWNLRIVLRTIRSEISNRRMWISWMVQLCVCQWSRAVDGVSIAHVCWPFLCIHLSSRYNESQIRAHKIHAFSYSPKSWARLTKGENSYHFDDNNLLLIANNVPATMSSHCVTTGHFMRFVHATEGILITSSISGIDWGACNVRTIHKSFLQYVNVVNDDTASQSIDDGIPNTLSRGRSGLDAMAMDGRVYWHRS